MTAPSRTSILGRLGRHDVRPIIIAGLFLGLTIPLGFWCIDRVFAYAPRDTWYSGDVSSQAAEIMKFIIAAIIATMALAWRQLLRGKLSVARVANASLAANVILAYLFARSSHTSGMGREIVRSLFLAGTFLLTSALLFRLRRK